MTAMEYREWAKIFVSLRNIEKTNGKIRDLQNKVKQLEGNQDE
jgi:hypothetical protein